MRLRHWATWNLTQATTTASYRTEAASTADSRGQLQLAMALWVVGSWSSGWDHPLDQGGQYAAIVAVWGCIVPVGAYNTPMGHTQPLKTTTTALVPYVYYVYVKLAFEG
jgi:hypothetical protein